MANEPTTGPDNTADRLHEAIASFEEARDAGLDPDPREWLRRYPDVAGRLADFFAARKDLGKFAAPPLPAGTPADPFPDIPDYQILEEIGPGGVGVVYRARHLLLDKIVAIKVLRPERVKDPEAVARFRREMKAVGRLQHANIVAAHHAGQTGGRHYLVMEFVAGLSLNEAVRRHGPLPVADACEVARQAALGLQHAHEHGLVHRDVKPGNLRLTPAGQVKVLDLGLAASRCEDLALRTELTASGSFLGTADYTAPEQWADPRRADIRADLYGLGCTLYHLLAGRPPFGDAEHDTWHKKMRAHEQAPVPPIRKERPEVPEGLAAVLDRLLAKQPGERFRTPAEVARALEPFCAGSGLGGLEKQGHDPGVSPSAASPALPDWLADVEAMQRRGPAPPPPPPLDPANWLDDLRLWVGLAGTGLDFRLSAVLSGEAPPASDAERIELARLCCGKGLLGSAARLFEDAFTGSPALAQDFKKGPRSLAARAAALAGCGRGEEAARLDEKQRAHWRKQALAWLRADLALYTKLLEGGTPEDRMTVARYLQHWQANPDLAGIRDAAAVARLPADEQQACMTLWPEVEALLARAQGVGN
jgi:serine/threonine protein kinase